MAQGPKRPIRNNDSQSQRNSELTKGSYRPINGSYERRGKVETLTNSLPTRKPGSDNNNNND